MAYVRFHTSAAFVTTTLALQTGVGLVQRLGAHSSLPCLEKRGKKVGQGLLAPGQRGPGAYLPKGFMEDGRLELDKRLARSMASLQGLGPFSGR